MEPNVVSIKSTDGANVALITVTQSGIDTAAFDLREWAAWANEAETPTSSSAYNLSSVRATGGIVACETQKFGFVADVTLSVSADSEPPAITVAVTHLWVGNFTKAYPISAQDRNAILAFIARAKFPEIGT